MPPPGVAVAWKRPPGYVVAADGNRPPPGVAAGFVWPKLSVVQPPLNNPGFEPQPVVPLAPNRPVPPGLLSLPNSPVQPAGAPPGFPNNPEAGADVQPTPAGAGFDGAAPKRPVPVLGWVPPNRDDLPVIAAPRLTLTCGLFYCPADVFCPNKLPVPPLVP